MKLYFKYAYIILIVFIIAGLFNPIVALLAIICMLGPIVLAIFSKGRFWCGNFCPRGSLFDNVLSKISPKRNIPKLFRNTYFRILIVIIMMSMFLIGIISNFNNPLGIGMVFYRMIVVTTIIGILLAFIYKPRTWCSFCPMGSIASFITRSKRNHTSLKVDSSCKSCKLCSKSCPMEIKPYEYKDGNINNSDCIMCKQCVYTCPFKSIS